MLTGMLTHGLTTCIYQQECCSLRHPGFYAGQPNKRQVFLNTLPPVGEVLNPAHFHPAGSRESRLFQSAFNGSFRLQSDMSGAQGHKADFLSSATHEGDTTNTTGCCCLFCSQALMWKLQKLQVFSVGFATSDIRNQGILDDFGGLVARQLEDWGSWVYLQDASLVW